MVKQASPKTPAARAAAETAPSYWQAARQPLCCLVFLAPLVVGYEMGALMLRPEVWPEQRLVAQRFIQQLAAWFGADAFWIPGAALVATLFIWHSLSRASWRLCGWTLLMMIAESLILALPLLVMGKLLQQAAAGGDDACHVQLILALGAGIYEELVFRFYLISGLIALLAAGFKMSRNSATFVAASLAALLFAACHFTPIGSESLNWPLFLMFAAAGGYLSLVFVLRGLGVATGCHVVFNLITLLTTTP